MIVLSGRGGASRPAPGRAEHGFGHSELETLMGREHASGARPDVEALNARLSGPLGLTELHNTFGRRHALAEIAGFFADGAGPAELDRATTSYLDHPTVRSLAAQTGHEARFTTQGLLDCEHAILDGAGRRREEQAGQLPAELVDRVIADQQPALNADQAAAVCAITAGGHGVEVVCALAGTGKTTMVATLGRCYQEAGYRVIGAAPTARAARELRSVAGVAAGTMHALLGELDRVGGFAEWTVLVIDEAGMAPTRRSAAIFAHAERSGTKVIVIGDPGQLASVQAGGWLAGLATRYPGSQLREVIRQHDPVLSDTLGGDGEVVRRHSGW
jgi:AAA domain